jgi:3-methyladenine DNA glycosylase AlkD
MLAEIQEKLTHLENPQTAASLQRFFKTGPGEYGAGDRFRGIRVPVLRQLAKQYRRLPLAETVILLHSDFHEDRLLALFILIAHYYAGQDPARSKIHDLYLKNARCVNNWDLVDASAPHLVGHYLMDRPKDPLMDLAASPDLWERRIAILSTFALIKAGDYGPTLAVARLVLGDQEDLIHKAAGWMLREVGKREIQVAAAFLKAHYRVMPRTMLRYAIERFPDTARQAFLKGTAG